MEGVCAVNFGWGAGEDGLWGNGKGLEGIQTRRGAKGVVPWWWPWWGRWAELRLCVGCVIWNGWTDQQGGVYAEWVSTEWEESPVWL